MTGDMEAVGFARVSGSKIPWPIVSAIFFGRLRRLSMEAINIFWTHGLIMPLKFILKNELSPNTEHISMVIHLSHDPIW